MFLSEELPEPLFLALSRQSQAFFVICVAIQAYYDDSESLASMEHFDNALQTFQSELRLRIETFDVSTFSAGLLLCNLCLIQGRAWTMFLERLYILYQLETNLSHLLPEADHDPGVHNVIEVMAIMDMGSMVIGRVNPSMELWRRLRKVQKGWMSGKIGGVEIVSGMPRTLLDIIADVGLYDAQDVEARLWAWPGEVGLSVQCLLWDCWRYTAVLDARRVDRIRKKKQAILNTMQRQPEPGPTASFPSREVVLCRLRAAIYALYNLLGLPGSRNLPVRHGLLYPLVIGSLEVPLLNANSDWKLAFKEILAEFLEKDPVRVTRMVDEFLDEAWKEGTDTFDIDEAARTRGVEIAVY
ncbi:uncharacterized protein RAG0_04260 [Rhynchosporium agropyri]|uniref:Uncharacterized protein n=1 Tax=Rhynchosporium agropyri TaxID=914238 RepID=A0A1E1K7Z7_9HELO|nr:uncharacterized protein RAG0_04260 [Rhynchosporium agropyri]